MITFAISRGFSAFGHLVWLAFAAWQICLLPAHGNDLEISGRTMGPIEYRVVVPLASAKTDAAVLTKEIQSTLDRVDGLMSTYQPDSDVSRFNATNSTDWFDVDSQTATVVQRAIEISRESNGAFDITVAPAVDLWKFGPDKSGFTIPQSELIESTKTIVGYSNLKARINPPAIMKTNAQVQIDLSGIAKGYAVDQLVRLLDSSGCEDFLVDIGGEIFARGRPTEERRWRLGIERPKELVREVETVANLQDVAMASSGDYRNFKIVQGRRYSHTIDPRTCRPVEHDLAAASVIAPDCMTADALATAVMVLGEEKGRQLCGRLGAPVFLVRRVESAGNQSFVTTHSDQFPFARKAEASRQTAGRIWPVFVASLAIFGLAILGMAIGAIFGNRPVQGSCGGLANMRGANGEIACSVCESSADCNQAGEAQSESEPS